MYCASLLSGERCVRIRCAVRGSRLLHVGNLSQPYSSNASKKTLMNVAWSALFSMFGMFPLCTLVSLVRRDRLGRNRPLYRSNTKFRSLDTSTILLHICVAITRTIFIHPQGKFRGPVLETEPIRVFTNAAAIPAVAWRRRSRHRKLCCRSAVL